MNTGLTGMIRLEFRESRIHKLHRHNKGTGPSISASNPKASRQGDTSKGELLANWCFARSSNFPGSALNEYARLEVLGRDQSGKIRATAKKLSRRNPTPFQIAVEVKTNSKGDDAGKGRGQIDETATQVCRGLNGLIDSFADRGLPFLGADDVLFLPVIITTANLWITESAINVASLETREI